MFVIESIGGEKVCDWCV